MGAMHQGGFVFYHLNICQEWSALHCYTKHGMIALPRDRYQRQLAVSLPRSLMKLLVFVTENSTADPTVDALVEQGFRVTRLASTGGFLRKGNTTLLAGVEEAAIERALAIARRTAPGALVITLDLERYERI
jgi:hypothetical protein